MQDQALQGHVSLEAHDNSDGVKSPDLQKDLPDDAYLQRLEHQRKQYYIIFLIFGSIILMSLLIASFYMIKAKRGAGLAEKTLQRFREDYSATLEAVNDGVYDWSIKTNYVSYSKAILVDAGI